MVSLISLSMELKTIKGKPTFVYIAYKNKYYADGMLSRREAAELIAQQLQEKWSKFNL